MKSRDKILQAAIPVFAMKGRHGAHMEEIAERAHINKAMIYYIFHSKDELYFEVLKYTLEQAWQSFSPDTCMDLETIDHYRESLSYYITLQMAYFNNNRDYTRVLVDAMSNGAIEIAQVVREIKASHDENTPLAMIKDLINNGKNEGYIRDVDTDQLVISMIGMIIVYFLTHSLSEILDIEIKDEVQFIESRKESIIDLILNGIINDNTVKTIDRKPRN